jgi:hypothetical protein
MAAGKNRIEVVCRGRRRETPLQLSYPRPWIDPPREKFESPKTGQVSYYFITAAAVLMAPRIDFPAFYVSEYHSIIIHALHGRRWPIFVREKCGSTGPEENRPARRTAGGE